MTTRDLSYLPKKKGAARKLVKPEMHFAALGHKVTHARKRLEYFEVPDRPDKVVVLRVLNFTSVCPVTGQPDYARLTIEYHPDTRCLESKSLKLYLMTYRNQGIFAEKLSEQIARDVQRALKPYWVRVTVNQEARGDIAIEASSSLRRGE